MPLQFISMFSSSDKSAIYLALSDHESGSPRQWYFLELAALEAKGPYSKRARWWIFLLARLGPALLTPALIKRGLSGAALYQSAAQHRYQLICQSLNDTILLNVSLLALLAGFERLTASQQFALWLLAISGASWQIWRTRATYIEPAAHNLPGAEASLGLYGLLIAKGLEPTFATQLLKGLRQQPAQASTQLQKHLPELIPPIGSRHAKSLKACSWLIPLLPCTWLLGLLATSWGWMICCLLLIAASYPVNRQWQTPALIGLATVCVYALARLVHWW
ncbi:hypothetical protein R6242_15985 [Iodobacter sp. CM08]|uniref:hypothetical protein n=1 Tax=Iodobacter sp. CM08 TaxID=3085902 RepID=UPI002980AE85|nr:hypothetical protein [Iodobacter sp. CM08]MDW5418066.1 hypothetical protein [Iodobacter sp. CM08]